MSMYGDYIKEHHGDEIIENDQGLAIYRYLNESQVYIVDIYVDPRFRKHGVASALADMVVDLARAKGCKELIGTVTLGANNSDISMEVLRGYGMRAVSANNNIIIYRKEI